MRFLYAAVFAFVFPAVFQIGFMAALDRSFANVSIELESSIVSGLLGAAPFIMMAAARGKSPGAVGALIVGLILTVAPWIVLVVDLMTAEPGRGVNIGLAMLMFVWPLVVFAAMFAVSFLRLPAQVRPKDA